jgi:bacterioferritin-associated ferredoxin
MIVCLCKAVRSSTIERLIDEGACSVECIGKACGAGTDCGGCRSVLDDMLDEAAERRLARRLPLVGEGSAAAE